jgi:adenylate cyclase, class 1
LPPSIVTLKQRLDAINQLRVTRTLAAGNPLFRYVYRALPLLLHYHHPELPGYLTGEVPHGICLFQESLQQQLVNHSLVPSHLINQDPPAIVALYSMGSSASLGQTTTSDLDLWICLQSALSLSARNALQKKCQLLSEWTLQYGVVTSFFIIDQQRFRNQNSSVGELLVQNRLHNQLLLEEFYRTQVRLAGKRLIWPIIPIGQEPHYENYLAQLYQQGILDRDHWFDLGGLKRPTGSNYFMAARQQLGNNLQAPYKAILKNLLLEIYAVEQSHSPWLALDFKRQLQQGRWNSFSLDPYCMVLDHITRYLTRCGDNHRLERVRRCFYRKVCDQTSHPITGNGWRQAVLRQVIVQWGWDMTHIKQLDGCSDEQCSDPSLYQDDWLREIEQNDHHLQHLIQVKHHNVRKAADRELSDGLIGQMARGYHHEISTTR